MSQLLKKQRFIKVDSAHIVKFYKDKASLNLYLNNKKINFVITSFLFVFILFFGLQKAIAKKQGDKEEMKEYGSMNAEMMKKEMMKKMEMMKAERDPAKMEMMKSEMMKEMMKEMKMEMMKKMKEMMKEYGSMNAMKKPMNAMAMKKESTKYLDTKAGSIQDIARQMFEKEHQIVEVKENDIEKMITDYLKKGGTITKLPPALAKGMKQSDMQKHKIGDKGVVKSMYKMKEVREFITTYNSHFLTNFKAEELILKDRLEG